MDCRTIRDSFSVGTTQVLHYQVAKGSNEQTLLAYIMASEFTPACMCAIAGGRVHSLSAAPCVQSREWWLG